MFPYDIPASAADKGLPEVEDPGTSETSHADCVELAPGADEDTDPGYGLGYRLQSGSIGQNRRHLFAPMKPLSDSKALQEPVVTSTALNPSAG